MRAADLGIQPGPEHGSHPTHCGQRSVDARMPEGIKLPVFSHYVIEGRSEPSAQEQPLSPTLPFGGCENLTEPGGVT